VLVTLDQARQHCRADAADDAVLTLYGGAASDAAVQFLNRQVFENQTALDAAIAGVPAALDAADAAYEAAILAAAELEGSARCAAEAAAVRARDAARTAAEETMRGIVSNDSIRAAVLLILGHLYRNREEVMTDQGAAAVQLPMGAHALLWPYRIGLGV
jgi:hypothetical protein